MKRAATERTRTLHRWRAHLRGHDAKVDCACERQAGRFRKGQRVGGCRRARCWLCHGDKLAGLPTLQERRAEGRMRSGIAEAGDGRGG